MENKCFICHEGSNEVVYKAKGYESLKCPECGLLFYTPLGKESVTDLTYDHHDDSFYRLSSKYKARWLKNKIGADKTLLEVGAGNGHLLNEFSNLGFRVCGLEPNGMRAQVIRSRYNLEALEGTIEDYEFRRKYDTVFHIDLLAHFPDPYLAIEKMKSVLNKDGYLCLEVGVVAGISTFWYKFFPLGLPQHKWLYSEKALTKLFETAQLNVVYKTTHSLAAYVILKRFFNIVLISILSRLLRPLIGERVSVFKIIYQKTANYLRYDLGRYMPKIGPLTILYVTKPV
ncbi:MAG: coq3 1 [Daejeonella sp.]|nr:coq3 1 [Daejeonella sp.]